MGDLRHSWCCLQTAKLEPTMYINWTSLICILLVKLVQGFPNGAPRCEVAKPGHGAEGAKVPLVVEREGCCQFNLSIKSPHRGVLVRADTPGEWSNIGSDLQQKDTCITHNSRSDKQSFQVIFTPQDPAIEPVFSGFVVEKYTLFHPLKPVLAGAEPKESEGESLIGSILNVFG